MLSTCVVSISVTCGWIGVGGTAVRSVTTAVPLSPPHSRPLSFLCRLVSFVDNFLPEFIRRRSPLKALLLVLKWPVDKSRLRIVVKAIPRLRLCNGKCLSVCLEVLHPSVVCCVVVTFHACVPFLLHLHRCVQVSVCGDRYSSGPNDCSH